jgi:hypothetical protein
LLDLNSRFLNGGYCPAPGPPEIDEPFYSFEVREIAAYAPASVAAAVLGFSGSRELHPPHPTWEEWSAVWEQADRQILLDDLRIFEESGSWAQLVLTCDCQLGDVLALWEAIRVAHPAVWVYGEDCRVFSPESFVARWTAA